MSLPASRLGPLALAALLLAGCAGDPSAKKARHFDRGSQHLAAGKYNEAIIEFRNALQIDSNFADARHGLGLSYRRKGWVVEARAELEGAAALKPEDPALSLDIANLLLELVLPDDALGTIRALLERDPGSARAHHFLGRALTLK